MNNKIMEVKFLKITAPEAVNILEDCMCEGYKTLDKIRNAYETHKDMSSNPSSAWSEWTTEWIQKTIDKLCSVYCSDHFAYEFREAKTNRYSTSGDRPYTGLQNTIEAKINILNSFYNFIMNRSSIVINYNGNINYQIGNKNKNEQS